MIVAERLALPLEKVSVRQGDTDAIPRGTGTYGPAGGERVWRAIEDARNGGAGV